MEASKPAFFKASFTKEAYEIQKKQAAAFTTAALIDPISDIERSTVIREETVNPVIINGKTNVPVIANTHNPEKVGSTASTVVMSACIVFVMIIFFACLALTGVITFNFGGGAGGRVVEMPNFENYMKDDAYIVQVADKYGLQITLQPASSDKYAEGVIYDQNIAPGTKIAKGSSVILTYSKGYSTVTLPNFTGTPFTETVYYLGKLNLSYNIVEKKNPGGQNAGYVATMTPAAGSVVYEGTEITIEIWGDAPTDGSVVGPNTGSAIIPSTSVLDTVFGSLSDSVSGLGDTISSFFE